MQIQLINVSNHVFNSNELFVCNSISTPHSFDNYDINIIDFNNENVWQGRGAALTPVVLSKDLATLKSLICNSSKSYTVIVLPSNLVWKYSTNGYRRIKDSIDEMLMVINSVLPNPSAFQCIYGQNNTLITDKECKSDFSFVSTPLFETMTVSDVSKDITTIKIDDRLLATTLEITNSIDLMISFLQQLSLIDGNSESIPEWLSQFVFYNDDELKTNQTIINNEINELRIKSDALSEQIDKNLQIKTVLSSTGDRLENVVKTILSDLFDYNFSGFEDVGKEDFRIVMPDYTIIGEVKGITTNVKKKNISQVDQHCQEYYDKLEEEGRSENVKGLLIVNHQRNLPVNDRESINEEQIKLAKRYEILIIETAVLLKTYEMFLLGTPRETIIELIRSSTGLLTMEMLEELK